MDVPHGLGAQPLGLVPGLQPACPSLLQQLLVELLQFQHGSLLQEELSQLLMRTVSFYDTASESFYHGLLLGLCAVLAGYYFISSNRESGIGRYMDTFILQQEVSWIVV